MGQKLKWGLKIISISNPHLHYTPGGSRTPNLRIRSPALYPLSYWGGYLFKFYMIRFKCLGMELG